MIYPWPPLFLTIFTSVRYISSPPSTMLTTLTLGALVLCGITLQVSEADPISTLCILQCDFAFSSKTQASSCDCRALKGLYDKLFSMNNNLDCLYVRVPWIIKLCPFHIKYHLQNHQIKSSLMPYWKLTRIVFKRAMITFLAIWDFIIVELNSFEVQTIIDL